MERKIITAIISAIIMITVLMACSNTTSNEIVQNENLNVTQTQNTNEVQENVTVTQLSERNGGNLVKQEKVDTSYITNKYLDVAYADISESQKMDIYLPENINEVDPVPVIVYVHGGGFKMGDKSSGILKSVLEGLNRGYAVVSVNYRLSSEAVFPAAVEDVKAAIRYLRANASEYNLDVENFAIWGESAGGNLASMIGTTGDDRTYDNESLGNIEQSSAVKVVIDWFGPIQFTEMDNQMSALGLTPKLGLTSSSTSPESLYVGADISKEENKELAERANPTNYITENDAAFLIQHGTNDTNVPVTQSENFAKALENILGSDKVVFEAMQGAGHGDFGEVKLFETEENIQRVFEFIDNNLKG